MKISNKKELQQITFNHSSDIDLSKFMKFYRDYTKEPYLFLVSNTILSSYIASIFRKNLLQITASEKIKTIDHKIEQRKSQYGLDRQIAKISALLSRNVSKHEFLTVEQFLPEKRLL